MTEIPGNGFSARSYSIQCQKMSRYKRPGRRQALKVLLGAHQNLERISRNLDAELAEAKEVSKALDEAINCIKGHNLREPEHELLRESMVAITSAANIIRKALRRQTSGIDSVKMASNLIGAEIVRHLPQ